MLFVIVIDGIDFMLILFGVYEGKLNLYVWMVLDSVLIYVENICDVFIEVDFENVEIYCFNVEVYVVEIIDIIVLLCDIVCVLFDD